MLRALQAVEPGRAVAYMSTLTNHITSERPAPFRGGVLADDMGLGKTLTLIACIAVNRPGSTLPEVTVVPRGSNSDRGGDGGGDEDPRPAKKRAKKASGAGRPSEQASAASLASSPSGGKASKRTEREQALFDAAAADALAAPLATETRTATLIVRPFIPCEGLRPFRVCAPFFVPFSVPR